MIGMTDIKLEQTTALLNSSFNSNNQNIKKNSNPVSEEITSNTKNDLVTLSSQISSANTEKKTTVDYTALEKKLGLDSSKWGVEAVSDDIFNFAKIVYENYKIKHNGEDNQKVLDNFYNMAKDSITKGYNEAMEFLGAIPEDSASLTKGTLDKSLEKLEAWYKNGGQDVEISETESAAEDSTEKTEETKSTATTTTETAATEEKPKLSVEELLKESEDIKNQVLEMLKQQGIYTTEKKTQRPFFEWTI